MLGGSPVRLLRLTPAGAQVLDRALGPGVDPTPATVQLLDRLADAGAIHPTPLPWCVDAPEASEVTVVVPVHDDADGLESLLASLSHSDPRPARAVVVDDASDDVRGDRSSRRRRRPPWDGGGPAPSNGVRRTRRRS